MVKDDPPATESTPNPEINISKNKAKKNKKKKKHSNRSETSVSSSSVSEVGTIPPVLDEVPKEEFYDAHESYHILPETPNPSQQTTIPTVSPAVGAALLVAQSEHGQNPKIQGTPSSGQTHSAGAARKEPSSVTKPVTGPN